jgi:hypothetical protein
LTENKVFEAVDMIDGLLRIKRIKFAEGGKNQDAQTLIGILSSPHGNAKQSVHDLAVLLRQECIAAKPCDEHGKTHGAGFLAGPLAGKGDYKTFNPEFFSE